ncbi:MAG: O-antigen ligase family protein [Deltaproteobacteria bacterium]|nr:O-antigen ligase family protein [Deltaproteobacteria bacterium]MBI3386197.1 O-antigen ligase family protein [Deltaproteobacteria bacterium]
MSNLTAARATPPRRIAEWAFALSYLLWLSQALDLVLTHFIGRTPGRSVGLGGSIAVILLLALDPPALRSVVKCVWPVLLIPLLALSSLLWSADVDLTLRATEMLTASTLFGLFLALRFSYRQQIELVTLTLAIAGIASAAVAVFFPRYGVMTGVHAGAWQGVFAHKNVFGGVIALAPPACTLLALAARKRTLALIGLVVSMGLVVMSRSRTALVVAVVCVTGAALLAALQRLPRQRRTSGFIVATAVVVLVAAVAAYQVDAILSWLGSDRTLNRRTDIWGALFDQVRTRPWLGDGYAAFWRPDHHGSRNLLAVYLGNPGHGHNGFLDLTLDLGVVGLAAFIIPYGWCLWRSFRLALANRAPLDLWSITFLIFFALRNFTESDLVQYDIGWVLYIAVALSLRFEGLAAQPPGRAPLSP